MNKYQFKNKTQLGIAYYYCYGDDRFENWLRIKNIKFKKLTEKMTSGKNLFNEKDKEIERLNNIINLIKNNIDITIQIIKEQPTGNDEWILERLNGIKNIGEELKEGKE